MSSVLIAPLDWGLGHATRCIPVIRRLLQMRHKVMLAGNGQSLRLLEHEFPYLASFRLPAYDPEYPLKGSMILKMLSQLKKFKRVIDQEHEDLEKIIQENRIDLVIADNRYGCWSKRIPSVIITHQSNVMMPTRFGWLGPMVSWLIENKLRNFEACWIPDYPDNRLSGDLAYIRNSLRKEYIGPLSRFTPSRSTEKKYDVAAIFSGPEPQRSIFEGIVRNQMQATNLKSFIVRGIPLSEKKMESANVANYLLSDELQQVIESSRTVIARCGYSTVMDLSALGGNAIFVPTPGQTEQEYLAAELTRKKIALSVRQDDFLLLEALKESVVYSGFDKTEDTGHLLNETLEKILKSG